jgi:hypothetical protein
VVVVTFTIGQPCQKLSILYEICFLLSLSPSTLLPVRRRRRRNCGEKNKGVGVASSKLQAPAEIY